MGCKGAAPAAVTTPGPERHAPPQWPQSIAARRLGVAHECLTLRHGGGKFWRAHPAADWSSVERAALHHYHLQGWNGCHGEGGLILNLLKAAAFPNLPPHHRATYSEALFAGNLQPRDKEPVANLLARIRQSDPAQIVRIFCVMATLPGTATPGTTMLDYFPHLLESHFTGLYASLGRDRLHDIAQLFGADAYEYRKGWPDLTLWRGTKVIFKEIKAPGDRLHASQKKTITDILLRLGYAVSLVDIVAAPDAAPD